nr:hypothetical protein [Tanacetum cinerariifolium]
MKDIQASYAKELPIPSLDPITPPVILTPSLVLPPSLVFDPRYFFVPKELLPPKKQIHPPSSSSTTLLVNLKQLRKCGKLSKGYNKKNVALIAKYFKKIYKPTNNNHRTSSNSRNKNVDTTQRFKNDNQSGQFRNQRTVNVAGARENVGSPLADTDEEIDEQELEAHYRYMTKIQEVPTADSCTDSEPVEQVQNDAGYNVFANDLQHSEQFEYNDQNDVESDDKRVALANLKHDIDENKKIQKQLKKANTTLAQELKECKTILAETRVNDKPNVSRPQHKSNQSRDMVMPNNSQLKVKKTQVEVRLRIPNVSNKMKSVTVCKDSLNSRTLNDNVFCATCNKCLVDSNHFACVTKMLNDVNARIKKPNVVPISTRKPKSQANKPVATHHKKKVASKSTNQKPQSYFRMLYEKTRNLKLLCNFVEKFLGTIRFGNDQFVPILGYGDLVQGYVTINRVYYVKGLNYNLFSVDQFYDADLEVTFRKSTCFVRDLQGNDLLIASPTQAWLWHRRLSHLNFDYINLLSEKDVVIGLPKLKYVKDQLCSSCELSKVKRSSFKSKVVPCSKGWLHLLHMDLCDPMRVASINGKKYILVIVDDYSRYTWTLFLRFKDETPEVLKDFLTMIQRNLQAPMITVLTDRGTKDGKNLDKMKEKGDPCILVGYSTQSKGYRVYNKRTRMIVESIYIRFDEFKEVSETSVTNNTSGLVPQRQKASDYDNPGLIPQRQDVSSSADANVLSQQELDLLFGPLYDEFFNAGFNPQDKQPSTNIQSTAAPSTPTYVHAEENNNDQAEEEQLPDDEFTNPLCALTQEVAESSSHNIGNSNVHTFNQPQVSEYQWKKDHPLEQVHRNLLRPVQTRRQLAIDLKMCMYALTLSTAEPKNIKEAMADYAWIEAMQEGIHQFDKLQEEVYVAQPDEFVDPDHPEKVYRLRKALYGLKQAPRAWYDELSKFLTSKGFTKDRSIGTPMATKPKLDADLSGNPVDKTDYRSKIRSLMYLTSSRLDIVQAMLITPDVLILAKPLLEGIHFLGDKLVSWMLKKQNCTAMSSAEAKYVALSASCAQVMWMRTQLQDYGFNYNKIPLYYDSQSSITISCNPVHHSRTKHIHTRRIGMRCLTIAELEVLGKESA